MSLHTRGIYFHPFVRPPVLWVPPLAGGFFLPFYSHYGPKPPAKTTTFLRGYFEVAFSRFLLRLCVDQGFEKPYVLGVSRFMSMDVPANGFA